MELGLSGGSRSSAGNCRGLKGPAASLKRADMDRTRVTLELPMIGPPGVNKHVVNLCHQEDYKE